MKKVKFKRASSDSTITSMVAGIFGIPATSSWVTTADAVDATDLSSCLPWAMVETLIYPWVENVVKSVYDCKPTDELIAHLLSNLGTVFLVKDEKAAGKDGLWLIVAESAYNYDNNSGHSVSVAPVRMVTGHAFVLDKVYTISAIQLTSCLRK